MRLHHLALRTPDLARLEAFYVGALGFAVQRRTDRSVWLDAGDAILMLERREPDEPEVDRRSMELACFTVAPGEGAAFARRLAAAGVNVEGRTRFTLYVRDPDGRRVGLSSYPEELS